MKKKRLYALIVLLLGFCFSFSSWKTITVEKVGKNTIRNYGVVSFDSTLVAVFYAKYPKLILYKNQVEELYKKHHYNYIWFDSKGRKEIADVMYNKINNLKAEGLPSEVPYKGYLDAMLQNVSNKPSLEVELFLSNYYFYYTNKVIQGIDSAKTEGLGWYLPRKKMRYLEYLDSLLLNPRAMENRDEQFTQYYKLRSVLQQYRAIEQNGGWKPILVPAGFKEIKPEERSDIVTQIRTRLYLTGDIATDSKSDTYESTLQKAVLKYKMRNGFSLDKIILPKHIDEMNVPVGDRIETLIVNMERCRWIPTDVTKAKQFIMVNIPSYQLTYIKNGKTVLVSKVVVGTTMNETAIFTGMLSYIVFSPYWNVPESIIKKEIFPAMKKNKNYLVKNHMEWNNGKIRQKPGPTNSLGLIKFLFPNTNNIYLHDTPAKTLFNEEKRAFSHGCIRVEKPEELARLILENDPNWTPEKIHEAMNKGKESWYTLKEKIPVHIGYFTAWVNEDGTVNFYKDIYNRDITLSNLLLEE